MEHFDESLLLYPTGDFCEVRGDAGGDGRMREWKFFTQDMILQSGSIEVSIKIQRPEENLRH